MFMGNFVKNAVLIMWNFFIKGGIYILYYKNHKSIKKKISLMLFFVFTLTILICINMIAYANTKESIHNDILYMDEENTYKFDTSNLIKMFETSINYDENFVDITTNRDYKTKTISYTIKPLKQGQTDIKFITLQSFIPYIYSEQIYHIDITDKISEFSIKPIERELYTNDTFSIDINSKPVNPNATNIKIDSITPQDNLKINNDGSLTALKAGLTTVTFKTIDGSDLSQSIDINIYDKTTELQFDISEINTGVNEEISISPITYPSSSKQDFRFSTDNEDILKIENNTITALDEGQATLSCTTTDGTDITASVTVNVFRTKPTEEQLKMVEFAHSTSAFNEIDVCQKFVRTVYENAFGIECIPAESAKYASLLWSESEIPDNPYDIPMGATLYCPIGKWGHVGIYDGKGHVIHQQNAQKMITEINEFISYYGATSWGWQNGNNLNK